MPQEMANVRPLLIRENGIYLLRDCYFPGPDDSREVRIMVYLSGTVFAKRS